MMLYQQIVAFALVMFHCGVDSRLLDVVFGDESDIGKFAVDIEEAVVTNLKERPFRSETVIPPIEKSARIRKELRPGKTEQPSLRQMDDDSVAALAKNLSCGFCEARLMWGDSGVIESPNFPHPYEPNMDCLWLLKTADEDARIQLVCDTIQLESCGGQNGFAPSWKDYLIISPLWNFKKSYVYCGFATTLNTIKHTSVCDQMAITFRSNNNAKNYQGFRCT